jgi:predicted CxxxxCH...CXXCH cytochrome family protein
VLVATLAVAIAAGACTVPRERPAGGVHPDGWGNEDSPSFHGPWLKQAGYPLADCRACHGDDYHGGAVGSSCVAGCHQEGVEACGTCHGDGAEPLPPSGAHAAHAGLCEACHAIPIDARGALHPNGVAEVAFSGVGALDPAAAWDPAAQRCAGVYCHGGAAVPWNSPIPDLGCDGCHGAPPASHARWPVAPAPGGCAPCHAEASGESHINGALDVLPLACDACHGQGPLGAPGDPGAGAHRRHLDVTLDDRIGAAAACDDCHPIPDSVADPGHLDTTAPADVRLHLGGHYDPGSGACTSWCHWDQSPGPIWTDASGAAQACDACHGSPPAETRSGTAHPTAQNNEACLDCHVFEPDRHVDGIVDLVP